MTTQTSDSSAPLSGARLWAAALFLIIIWGTAFTMVDVGVRYMSPLWLVSLRTLMGAFLITVYAYIKGYRFPPIGDPRWRWYFVLGVTGMAMPFFLTSWGQETIDSGISAILVGVMPLLTILLAHFFTEEKLSWRKLIGFTIGLGGTVILFLPDNFSLELIKDWKAQLAVLGAALCYAATTVGAKRAPQTPALLGAALMTLCAAISVVFITLMTDGLPSHIEPMGWLMAIGLAVGSTGFATIVYLQVIESNGPTTLAKINYFPPFVSVIAGIALLNESFTPRIAIAFGTIMLGVWIARNKKNVTVPQNP